MSSPNRQEAAARHLPVAHQRSASGAKANKDAAPERSSSETRLQAAVIRTATRDERDPYADVPCTD